MDGHREPPFDPAAELARIRAATGLLLRTAARLCDADVRAPSLLPGWSRGHVLTHLARNADGGRRLLSWARTGVPTPEYPGLAERDARIEAGAGRGAAELVADRARERGRLRGRVPADAGRGVAAPGAVGARPGAARLPGGGRAPLRGAGAPRGPGRRVHARAVAAGLHRRHARPGRRGPRRPPGRPRRTAAGHRQRRRVRPRRGPRPRHGAAAGPAGPGPAARPAGLADGARPGTRAGAARPAVPVLSRPAPPARLH
ncbi:maleylpyruvate isomerase N-terminal domain-containing protein [Kitasatospora aureofaciens]|uniref:maleylpyruvate isomerase N-terminal domain-containing protein n=1 Tax=Kitasatospora aureofaciens TaxID=1894 RepID=UPI0033CC7443